MDQNDSATMSALGGHAEPGMEDRPGVGVCSVNPPLGSAGTGRPGSHTQGDSLGKIRMTLRITNHVRLF